MDAKPSGISLIISTVHQTMAVSLSLSLAPERVPSSTSMNFVLNVLFSKKLIVFELIFSLLGMMLDPNSIRSEDVDTLFANLAANPLGNTMVCHEYVCYSVKNVINVLSLDLGIGFPWSALE